MRRVSRAMAIACCCAGALGCPLPPSNAAYMQQTAADFNTNVRFGRNELAVEQVMPDARDEFLQHRREWGKGLTLADYELVGAKMVDDDNADVSIKYSWYRSTDNELHETTVKQHWRKRRGDWKLATEVCSDGDAGIFGDDGPRRAAGDRAAPRSVQFPNVRFGD